MSSNTAASIINNNRALPYMAGTEVPLDVFISKAKYSGKNWVNDVFYRLELKFVDCTTLEARDRNKMFNGKSTITRNERETGGSQVAPC